MLVLIDVSEHSEPLLVSDLDLKLGQYIRISEVAILMWEQDYRKCRHKLPMHDLSNYHNIAYPDYAGVRVIDYTHKNVGNVFGSKVK